MNPVRHRTSPRSAIRTTLVLGAAVAALPGNGLVVPAAAAKPAVTAEVPPSSSSTDLVVTRASEPDRSVVSTAAGGWLATFTDGARTVTMKGARRTFREPGVLATVTHDSWARLLEAPFAGVVDHSWLEQARSDRSPDVLATAFAYVTGAPIAVDAGGLRIAGDASYGPLDPDGTRREGSDWNDYQQVTHRDGATVDRPEPEQAGALDCSGYVRMVFGRRLGVAMTLAPDGIALPRRSSAMATSAPGVLVVPDRGSQVTATGSLGAGDLVLFDASADDGTDIDHVGMYLGRDDAGRHRFTSSRASADGPTMGDARGRSVLDGTGLYARALRAVRRI